MASRGAAPGAALSPWRSGLLPAPRPQPRPSTALGSQCRRPGLHSAAARHSADGFWCVMRRSIPFVGYEPRPSRGLVPSWGALCCIIGPVLLRVKTPSIYQHTMHFSFVSRYALGKQRREAKRACPPAQPAGAALSKKDSVNHRPQTHPFPAADVRRVDSNARSWANLRPISTDKPSGSTSGTVSSQLNRLPVFWFSANPHGPEPNETISLISKFQVAYYHHRLATSGDLPARNEEDKLHQQAAALAKAAPNTDIVPYVQGLIALDWYGQHDAFSRRRLGTTQLEHSLTSGSGITLAAVLWPSAVPGVLGTTMFNFSTPEVREYFVTEVAPRWRATNMKGLFFDDTDWIPCSRYV